MQNANVGDTYVNTMRKNQHIIINTNKFKLQTHILRTRRNVIPLNKIVWDKTIKDHRWIFMKLPIWLLFYFQTER